MARTDEFCTECSDSIAAWGEAEKCPECGDEPLCRGCLGRHERRHAEAKEHATSSERAP
jgi:hypothetical protein